MCNICNEGQSASRQLRCTDVENNLIYEGGVEEEQRKKKKTGETALRIEEDVHRFV